MTTYTVEGMTCGGCVRSVLAAVERAAPGAQAEVSLEKKELVVATEHDEARVKAAVEAAGFDVTPH